MSLCRRPTGGGALLQNLLLWWNLKRNLFRLRFFLPWSLGLLRSPAPKGPQPVPFGAAQYTRCPKALRDFRASPRARDLGSTIVMVSAQGEPRARVRDAVPRSRPTDNGARCAAAVGSAPTRAGRPAPRVELGGLLYCPAMLPRLRERAPRRCNTLQRRSGRNVLRLTSAAPVCRY